MSYAVPLSGSPLREAFELEDLVAIGYGERDVPDLPKARRLARGWFEGAGLKPARVFYIVLRADDHLDLISIGPRGGWKREWRFGRFKIHKRGGAMQ